jgi:hypothetical protein
MEKFWSEMAQPQSEDFHLRSLEREVEKVA